MKTIQIPTTSNPFIVNINNNAYSYAAGETIEVPDEVAEIIESHMDAQPTAQPQHTEAPQASGFAYSSAERKFELIGTIDFSSVDMAKAGASVEFGVKDVGEILAVWKGMVNSSSTNSYINLYINEEATINIGIAKTGKSGTSLNGYTKFTVYEGVGATIEVGAGALSATNYNPASAEETTYNLLPFATKINKIKVVNPPTQYYAVGGVVEIYVR